MIAPLLVTALLHAAPQEEATPVDASADLSLAHLPAPAAADANRWPAFRGAGSGHTTATLPLTWSETEHLAWRRELAGFGQSSPVVWDGVVVVTSVSGEEKETCHVTALSLGTGEVRWQRDLDASQRVPSSEMVSRGAPSPAVDAERIVAFFESGDLFALRHDGEPLWHRSLCTEYGPFEGNHGVASSVVLHAGSIYLLLDHEGASYLVCIDAASGENRWKLDRASRVSWSTPVVDATGGQLLVSSNGVLQGIDLEGGEVRWETEVRGNTVASPTVLGDVVVVGSSEAAGNVLARIDAGAAATERVLWTARGARPSGFGSPLVADGSVFLVNKSGSLSCLDLTTGESRWDLDLAEGTWASPIAAGGRLYFFGKEGRTTVVAAREDGGEVLATNALETEGTVYGAAAVEGRVLLREGTRLTCVAASAD